MLPRLFQLLILLWWATTSGSLRANADASDPSTATVHAGVPILKLKTDQKLEALSLLPYTMYLEDEMSQLHAQELAEPPIRDRFRVIDGYGVRTFAWHPFWLRIIIENETDREIPVYFRSAVAYLDHVDLYRANAGRDLELLKSSGDLIKDVETYRLPLLPAHIPPGRHTFFVRIETAGPMNMNFDLWDPNLFDAEIHAREYIGLGLLFGIVLVMAAYNLFLAIRLRNPAYFLYVAYILSFAGVQFCFTGLAQHLLPQLPFKTFYVNEGIPIQAEICAIFGSLFAISFLGLRAQSPRIILAMRLFFGCSIINIVICLFNFNLSISIVLLTNAYISSVLLYAGLRRCLDRYRPAYFYTAAWVFIIVGSMITMGRIYGLLPDNNFTTWTQFLGGAIEVILLSLALGDKLSLEQEKSHQQITQLNAELGAANHLLKEHIENVEAIVEAKTRDIRSMMDHIPMGVFMIAGDQLIHRDYSRTLLEIFPGGNLETKKAIDLICEDSLMSPDEKSQVASCLCAAIGEDIINFEVNNHALPQKIKKQTRNGQLQSFDLTWNAIENSAGTVEKILVTIRDVTELETLQEKAHDQQEELDFIAEILKVPTPSFLRFIQSCKELILASQKLVRMPGMQQRNLEILKLIFINMHTMKGSARSLYLKRMTRVFHEIEQSYETLQRDPEAAWDPLKIEQDLEEARRVVNLYETIGRDKLGRSQDQPHIVEFRIEQIEHLYQRFSGLIRSKSLPRESLDPIMAAQSLFYQRIFKAAHSVIVDLSSCLSPLAKELKKEIPVIDLKTSGILLNEKGEELFRKVFVHILRNSLDHGFESTKERLAEKKSPRGTISLQMERIGDKLLLRYRDDGRGLALKKIAASGQSLGLLTTDSSPRPQEVANLIFSSGLSTAQYLTDVSGRGVGMAAVKDFIENAGGSIKVDLHGSTFELEEYRAFSFRIELPFLPFFEEAQTFVTTPAA